MVAAGMQFSKLFPCLFIGDHVMAVAFVDDILFWSTDQAYINKLGSRGSMEQEDKVVGYLGV